MVTCVMRFFYLLWALVLRYAGEYGYPITVSSYAGSQLLSNNWPTTAADGFSRVLEEVLERRLSVIVAPLESIYLTHKDGEAKN